jgi:hypothetical protein
MVNKTRNHAYIGLLTKNFKSLKDQICLGYHFIPDYIDGDGGVDFLIFFYPDDSDLAKFEPLLWLEEALCIDEKSKSQISLDRPFKVNLFKY